LHRALIREGLRAVKTRFKRQNPLNYSALNIANVAIEHSRDIGTGTEMR